MSDFATRLVTVAAAFGPALPIGLLLASESARRGRPAFVPIAIGAGGLAPLCVMATGMLLALVPAFTSVLGRDLFRAFAVAGIPEETAKFCLFTMLVLGHERIDPERDAPMAGGWVGLGFALLENFLYVTRSPNWLAVAGLRALTAVPAHVTFGLIMGTFATRAMRGEGRWATALVVPILLHGLYDFALMAGNDVEAHSRAALLFSVLLTTDLAVMAVLLVVSTGGDLARQSPDQRGLMLDLPRIRRWQQIGAANAVAIVLIIAGLVGAAVYMTRFGSPSDWPLIGSAFLPIGLLAMWLRCAPDSEGSHPGATGAGGPRPSALGDAAARRAANAEASARLAERIRSVANRPASGSVPRGGRTADDVRP